MRDKKILDWVPLSKMDRILVNLACLGEGNGALEGWVDIGDDVWQKMREDESVSACAGLASQVFISLFLPPLILFFLLTPPSRE